jgi:hypothetical protein
VQAVQVVNGAVEWIDHPEDRRAVGVADQAALLTQNRVEGTCREDPRPDELLGAAVHGGDHIGRA